MFDIHRQMKSIISNRQCSKEIIFENDNMNMTSAFGFKQGNFHSLPMSAFDETHRRDGYIFLSSVGME